MVTILRTHMFSNPGNCSRCLQGLGSSDSVPRTSIPVSSATLDEVLAQRPPIPTTARQRAPLQMSTILRGRHRFHLLSAIIISSSLYRSYGASAYAQASILNTYRVPMMYRGSFQLITNFGTSEHVTDQINTFRVIH